MNRFALVIAKCASAFSVVAVWVGLGLPVNGFAQTAASDIPISNFPLEGGLPPPPNVLLIMDDSGSMDWEVVYEGNFNSVMQVDRDNTIQSINNRYFLYSNLYADSAGTYLNLHPYDDKDGHAVPTHAAVLTFLNNNNYAYSTQLQELWRARNSSFNSLYYDPEKRYEPWPGGQFENSLPKAARVNPNSTTATIDLTVEKGLIFLFPSTDTTASATAGQLNINNVALDNSNSSTQVETSVYIPMYYTANSNGQCGSLVEIRPTYTELNCDGSATGTAQGWPATRGAGRTDCTPVAGTMQHNCNYDQEIQNFANWFTYHRKKEFAAKAAFAEVVNSDAANDINLGFSTVNVADPSRSTYMDNNGATVNNSYRDVNGNPVMLGAKAAVGSDVQTVTRAIYETTSGPGGTQLLRALNGAGEYFKCDGNPNVFAESMSCPRLPVGSGGACQANMTVLMTDGFWEVETGTGADSEETSGSLPVSYTGQDEVTDTVFTGGAFAKSNLDPTLADVAMYWYKNDLDTAANNSVPMSPIDNSRLNDPNGQWTGGDFIHQHMKTFTVGFAVFNEQSPTELRNFDQNGNWLPPPDPSATTPWPTLTASLSDSNKLEDLKHAAYNGRGKFYSAKNADQLVFGLTDAIKSTLLASGASSAVSFNSESVQAGNVVYAASFNTETNSGDVVAYRLDTDGSIVAESWRASETLATQVTRIANCANGSHNRNLVTFNAQTGGEELVLGQGVNLDGGEIDWLHGLNSQESHCASPGIYRSRENSTGNGAPYLIGDIVNSRPLYVGAPSFGNRTGGRYPSTSSYDDFVRVKSGRIPLVLVGTNGGMFHAFNATNGEEAFAFIPDQTMNGGDDVNQVEDLTRPDYSHKWYLDLSPAVNDVFIKPANSSNHEWRTVVIGGYRAGGKGYFALDVTEGGQIDSVQKAEEAVMWEFGVSSLNSGDRGKLGLSYSVPLIAMTNEELTPTENGNRWAAIFGNGYNSEAGTPSLFILDVEDGLTYSVITPANAPSSAVINGETVKNGLSTPRGIDVDGNGTIDFAYAGDLAGNLWRFDLRDINAPSATLIFEAKIGSTTQPITTQPMVVTHPIEPGKFVVMVSTGSWLTRDDVRSTSDQSLYGITDDPTATPSNPLPTRDDLEQRTLTEVPVQNAQGVTEIFRQISGVNSGVLNGWYLDLKPTVVAPTVVASTGERAVKNMVYRGGYVFFNTVIPGGVSCDAQVGSALMALNPQTGLLDKTIFDFNGDGDFNPNENFAGRVNPNTAGSDVAMLSSLLMYQATDSSGNVTTQSVNTNTDTPGMTGRLSWRQIQ